MVTRIRTLLEHKQLSPTQFADLIGVGRPVMSHILSERNKPSLEVVQRIISAMPEISIPWLLSGAGAMLAEEVATDPKSPAATNADNAIPAPTPAPALPEGELPVKVVPSGVRQTAVVAEPVSVRVSPAPASAAAPPLANVPAAAPLPAVAELSPEKPAIAAFKPFRPTRFTPTAPASTVVASTATTATNKDSLAANTPALEGGTPPPVVPAERSPSPVPVSAPAAAAPLPSLTEPGKAIRRIVIFYRDGSFADYCPEQ
ncbi:helix-turn-helix domain-containing protein [Hymenobacter baengnokdamensis]|uniref:helix-turn-helix domain-containing protein n=1 Tax=Hymenobacter baengnokdamensis TaxID=2615203 RepID=UPI00124530C2